MKDFLEFCNEMAVCCDNTVALPETAENYVDGGKVVRPEKVQSYKSNRKKLDDCTRSLCRNFFMSDPGKMLANFGKIVPSVPFSELYAETSSYMMKWLRSKNITVEIPKASDAAGFSKKMNKVLQKTGIAPQEFWNDVGGKLTTMAMHQLKTKEDYALLFNNIRKAVKDVNTLLTDDIKNYKTYEELGDEADTHPYAEKIEQLKRENANDPEYCRSLDKANELLVSANKEALKYSSDLCESIPSAYHRVANDMAMGYIEGNQKFQGKVTIRNKSTEYVGKNTPEERIGLAKDLAAERLDIPESQKQAIKKIVAKIVDYKLFDPASYSLEKDSPRGFMKISELTAQLAQAVNDGNKEKIVSLQKELTDISAKTDEVLADLKKVDLSMSMAGNTASGRDGNRLAKYRMDVLGTSRLNTLWLLIATCHHAGMDVNEVIDHPVQAFSKLTEIEIIERSPVVEFGKTNDLSEVINETAVPGSKDFNSAAVASLGVSDNLQRSFEGLALITGEGDTKTKWIAAQNIMFSTQINETTEYAQNALFFSYGKKENVVEGIKNMLAVEKEDRNLILIAPGMKDKIDYQNFTTKKPFDRDGYLKTKTDPRAVAERIKKVIDDYSDPEKKYVKSVARANVFAASKELIHDLKAIAKDEATKEALENLEEYVKEREILQKPEQETEKEIPQKKEEVKEEIKEEEKESVPLENTVKTEEVKAEPIIPEPTENETPNADPDGEIPPAQRPSDVSFEGVGFAEARTIVEAARETIAMTWIVGENGKRFCKMELLNALKARHESRGFFSKLRFISNAREANLIESLKTELRADGVTEEQLAEITETGRPFNTSKWWNVTHGRPVADEPVAEEKKPDVREMIGEKVTAKTYPQIIKGLAELKKEYDRHGFFGKLFTASVRLQKQNIDDLVSKIAADTGIGKEEIKENARRIISNDKISAAACTLAIQEAIEDKETIEKTNAKDAEKTTVFENEEQFRANSEAEFKEQLAQTYGKKGERVDSEVTSEKTGPIQRGTNAEKIDGKTEETEKTV